MLARPWCGYFFQSHRNVCLYVYIVACIFYILSSYGADGADNAEHVTAIIISTALPRMCAWQVSFAQNTLYTYARNCDACSERLFVTYVIFVIGLHFGSFCATLFSLNNVLLWRKLTIPGEFIALQWAEFSPLVAVCTCLWRLQLRWFFSKTYLWWCNFGVNFLCFCVILISSIQLRIHWWMTWWVMNDCHFKAHASVLMRVWAS